MTLTRENIPAALIGDPARLRQVLSNLVSNAVKFTEAGHIRLQCAWQPDPQVLHVVLEDSGVGIPADRLQTIFDPFMQSDNSVARTYGGTGLGLSISARIVRLMGGEIELESSLGRGSRFRFSLPLQAATALPATTEPAPATATNSVRAGGAAVLVVEDTPVNQTIIRIGLERMGYRVDTAGNGAEAIRKVEQGDYAVVLMDCHMPGMDGYAATTAIRDFEVRTGRRRLPIIAVTASVTGDEQARCRAAGMDDYLSKPFSIQELDAMLRQHLDAG
jgi:CheY-like chemotaxis protein